MKTYKRVLSIAGSDSGGGAGIQADLKTFGALGCYGMTVITAITAQNTLGVQGVWPMSVECVGKQLDAVLSDIGADAVKIGMLWSEELSTVVAELLQKHRIENVVFDPVMVAQSGDNLLSGSDSHRMIRHLAPVAHVVTPNITEASRLLGYEIPDYRTMEKAARDLSTWGFKHVLLKGGHLEGEGATDALYLSESDELILFPEKRVVTQNNHGTGCTLSSAIAAFLARGSDLKDACFLAKQYITQALVKGADYDLGKGHGPVHHFHGIWE